MTVDTRVPIRVLLVDDDRRFVAVLRALLKGAQGVFAIDTVDSVGAAVAALALGAHDVCLLDYHLGTEDGLDVLPKVRARDIRIPIILLTGEQDESLELTAITRGAADYLNKSELEPRRLERTMFRAIARHRVDHTLREREARVADAEARALVMATHIGLDGRWLKVSRRFSDLLGYDEDEFLRLGCHDVTHPDDLARDIAERERLLDGTARSVEYEKRFVRKDGAVVWAYMNCSLVADESGGPICLLTYVRDITAQKDMEERLRQAHKMEAVGQLAGGVAHDFNNLLTAILGYTDLLRDEWGNSVQAHQDLEEVHKAATSAAALTAQLLAFSRKQVLKTEIVSPNAIIESTSNLLTRVLGEDVALVTELDGDAPRIEVDPVQLQQVLLNLASNARDAMPRGGRLLITTSTIETTGAGSAGRSLAPGRYAVIAVTDTGSGMDQETQARVFEPFFTTKAHGKGTGLGLATVYGIVTQSGGDIVCETAPGAGTTFTIFFPATEKTSTATLPSPGTTSRGTGTILLVEDRLDVRQLTRRILESRGYRVVDTGDPESALRLADTATFDLLLTDVVMPEMSGPELADRLRARCPGVPVVFMSGFPGHSALNDTRGAPLIRKPFTPDGLARKVRETLDQPSDAR